MPSIQCKATIRMPSLWCASTGSSDKSRSARHVLDGQSLWNDNCAHACASSIAVKLCATRLQRHSVLLIAPNPRAGHPALVYNRQRAVGELQHLPERSLRRISNNFTIQITVVIRVGTNPIGCINKRCGGAQHANLLTLQTPAQARPTNV